jgi:hypothetical protein
METYSYFHSRFVWRTFFRLANREQEKECHRTDDYPHRLPGAKPGGQAGVRHPARTAVTFPERDCRFAP